MNAREGYRTAVERQGARACRSATRPRGSTSSPTARTRVAACCWDFGSVSPDPTQYVTMNTLFFGTGFWGKGAGSGPWFMGDFEGGVWAGGSASATGHQQQATRP